MGGYYARAEGLSEAVADAIRDHYKPVGQSDEVPTAPVTVAVALADKLDTLVGFFAIDEKPTGSKDPFALRRAALGILSLIRSNNLRVNPFIITILLIDILARQFVAKQRIIDSRFGDVFEAVWPEFPEWFGGIYERRLGLYAADSNERFYFENGFSAQLADTTKLISCKIGIAGDVQGFIFERLRAGYRQGGVNAGIVDAVFSESLSTDIFSLLMRMEALAAFIGTEDGANLLAGYKRAANILKKEEFEAGVSNPDQEPAEAALVAALDAAEPRAAAAIEAEDFTTAMAALATLRGAVDAFFETVTVNDADPVKRAARLGLLARLRAAVHKVADFSRIEG
jgi:glycyl-tRNA synthetase beta chain